MELRYNDIAQYLEQLGFPKYSEAEIEFVQNALGYDLPPADAVGILRATQCRIIAELVCELITKIRMKNIQKTYTVRILTAFS